MSAQPWVRTRNILAWPYGWQRPAKTEEWACEELIGQLKETPFVQLVCFPWAALIDLLRKDKAQAAEAYFDALRWIEPRSTLCRATVCQHIWAKDLIPVFKRLKITDVFWCHSTRDEAAWDGIRVHSFPLYPVRFLERSRLDSPKPLAARSYLYSFMGTYQPGLYRTASRNWIFELPQRPDALVVRRNQWHYESHVYGEQVNAVAMTPGEREHHNAQSREYETVLADTIFSLCPSGSGANSIRLWESLGFGCIPVVASQDFQPPVPEALWRGAVLQISETPEAVRELPARLAAVSKDAALLERMRTHGRLLYEACIQNPSSLIATVLQKSIKEAALQIAEPTVP